MAIIEYLNQGHSTILEQHTQKYISKNEFAHILLIGRTHNKQGSKDARVRIVVLLTLSLIKSHEYFGAVLLTALCVKRFFFKIILS